METVSTALNRRPLTRAKLRLQVLASSLKASSLSMTRRSSRLREKRGKTFPYIQTTKQRRASIVTCSKVQPDSSNKFYHLSRTDNLSVRKEILALLITSSVQEPSLLVHLNNAISQVEDSVIWDPEGKSINSSRIKAR